MMPCWTSEWHFSFIILFVCVFFLSVKADSQAEHLLYFIHVKWILCFQAACWIRWCGHDYKFITVLWWDQCKSTSPARKLLIHTLASNVPLMNTLESILTLAILENKSLHVCCITFNCILPGFSNCNRTVCSHLPRPPRWHHRPCPCVLLAECFSIHSSHCLINLPRCRNLSVVMDCWPNPFPRQPLALLTTRIN